MMFRFRLVCFTFFSVSCIGIWVKGLDLNLVPDHLLSCYKNRPPVLPQTMDTLIEIIRKIEIQPTVNMDIRMFSNVLLHKFRVDGIERDPSVQTMPGVVPFRTSGFQAYRQRILLQQLILDNMANFPLSILSETEKCNLHWMLSSTVDAWERGDESTTCSSSIQGFMNSPPQRFGAKLSSCPEEWGIVYQEHGTVSPGTVIAGIAAGLAPLQINQSLLLTPSEYGAKPIGWNVHSGSDNSSVDNVFVATLAGDLAEVIQFQAGGVRDIYLGPPGVWNNTYIPTAYYFNNLDYNRIEKKAWQITDAEMTGGIDGLILSKQVPPLENQSRNLRLSQVLDMYYSDRGLFSDSNMRACSREMNIADFINRDKQTFISQVKAFANVLATKVSTTYHTDENFIDSASRQTIDRFTPYLSDSLRKIKCVSRSPHSEKMNLNIIIDQTWTSDMSLQWILFLGRAIDVGYYSSSVSVINGYRGTLITHLSQNTTDIYLNWKSSSTEPYELYLPLSLVTLRATIENAIHRDKLVQRYKSQSHVALIIGYSSTIRDEDHLKAKALVSDIKALNPDMRFVYVTSRVNNYKFVQLTALPGSQNDKIVVLDNVNNVQSFVSQLQDPLSSVPRSLVASFCTGKRGTVDSEYEEYVTPGQPIKYRIHPDYLCGSSKAQIKLINWDYGDIMACVSRSELSSGLASQCRTLRSNEQYTFSIPKPCERPKNKNNEAESKQEWLETCKPIFLDVSTQSSSKRCSERECRFPDQVKFNIVLQGLNCVEPFKTICSSALIISPSVIVFISVFVVFFVNNLL